MLHTKVRHESKIVKRTTIYSDETIIQYAVYYRSYTKFLWMKLSFLGWDLVMVYDNIKDAENISNALTFQINEERIS